NRSRAAGAAARDRLAAAWPDRTRVYEGPGVREAVTRAFGECDQLVCFLATGATVRLLAPLLADKTDDPGVVCVDEAQQHAVSLLGGHAGGANELARAVADVLSGCRPVVTTATDAVGVPGLDTLGWPVEGAVAAVSRALLDGATVPVRADARWPLPALPPNAVPAGSAHGAQGAGADGATLWVTDKVIPLGRAEAVLRPPSLAVGVGASRGVTADEVLLLVEETLDEAGLSVRSVTELATVDAKANEPGLLAAAERLGVPLRTYPAEALSAVEVPNPSDAPRAAVGTPSVAEAAALLAAAPRAATAGVVTTSGHARDGHGGLGELVVPKTKSAPIDGSPAMATAAVARRGPRGRLAVVGLGPGARDLVTPRAREELRRASVLVGLDQYVDQIRDLLRPGTRVVESGLGAEEERARTAVAEARAGHAVALIGSGDAGVYAMASPALAE
ncbi:cobalamin biosynthesis protein, partial [Streptomyces daliensis]|nr:cobalamin biosynthesis protein [Streptomyces daliensis]